MRLSILIPSYKRADLLSRCLASVCEHAPPWAEVLVLDDASEKGIISRTARTFPRVGVHRMPSRQGFCGTVNHGLELASGEFVELLNDDTIVTANWCEAALEAFQNPRVAAVAPLVLQLPEREQPRIDSAGDCYDVGGFAFKRGHGQPVSKQFEQPGEVWGVSGAAGFFRRQAVLDVGCLPTDFGAYFEDVDLAHRLRACGHLAWFVPRSRVWHEVSGSYGRKPRRRTLQQQSCNEERLFWRHTPSEELLRLLPRHAAVLALKAARRLAEGAFLPWFTGRLQAWQVELSPLLVRGRSRC